LLRRLLNQHLLQKLKLLLLLLKKLRDNRHSNDLSNANVELALAFSFCMNISDCYKVGFILKPHGLKGEVTISVDADFPEDVSDIDCIFVEQNLKLVPYFFEAISFKGDKAYVKFEDVDTHESANSICKSVLYLPKITRPKSARGEFYDDEVIGFEVHDEHTGLIGTVASVQLAGPNKLLEIEHNGKEILIPVNAPFITSINKSKKKISVDLPDGYLDI
jgi:16S rRNA processing protein RimM